MDARKLIDPELKPALEMLPFELITRDNIMQVRETLAAMNESMGRAPTDVSISQRVISTRDGETTLYIFKPENVPKNNPALLWIHGGGYIMGDGNDVMAAAMAERCGCTVISVNYRIAPEHPFPAGPEDCHAALVWVYENAAELGINPNRFAIGGASAGAGMAAGVSLMNRDRKGPPLAFQYLLYPMLDNMHDTPSGKLENHAVWSRQTSLNAWEMYLDGTPGEEASSYAAPCRARDLSGLPTTYMVVGAQDLFRDENITYAQRLMAADVPTQLEVFPGVFHGAEGFVPEAKISKRMRDSYHQALKIALMEAE